ncbi:LysM domain-containing protein [Brevundimonas sp.]|uniref:LysM peptidoglycan-binding domain-containing protein n=1 Tax=Brevundimonas sp. TaxID=1871086 RepID=UPI00289AC286|nr:LysM domain-containing protein [Brevundimonas sp.]
MRTIILTALILATPAIASAQAHQTTRTIVDNAGRRVTCSVGQIGSRQTRGVAIVSPYTSTIDAAPSDALWRSSGCAAEMSMSPSERAQRTLDMIAAGPNGPPTRSYEEIMASLRETVGQPAQSPAADLGGATYVTGEGDSVVGISRRFGVSIDAIEAANGRHYRGEMPAGVRIVLPDGAKHIAADPYATGRPAL